MKKNGKVFPPGEIPLQNIVGVSCGQSHIVCVDIEGTVFSFGGNSYGQLGVSTDSLLTTSVPQLITGIPPCKQVACGESFTMLLSDSGNVYSFGRNAFGQLGIGNDFQSNST